MHRALRFSTAQRYTFRTAFRNAPVAGHIEAWIADLERANRSPDYIRKVGSRIKQLCKDLRWVSLGGIMPDGLTRWMGLRIRNGLGERTANHYLETAVAFCNWCVAQRRLERNPVATVTKANVIEPRCVRRAATIEELQRLLLVSGKRSLVYLTAVLTGLRRKELRLLEWRDVILDGPRPRLALRAATTKSRRADTLPIPSELAEELGKQRPRDCRPTDRVYSSIPKSSTFKNDLKRAGIECTSDGGKLDLHALRTTFGTLLATSKVDIREAMELMRHTDIRLTTKVYTDPRLINTHGAAAQLPRIQANERQEERTRATGTDGAPTSADQADNAHLRMAPCMARSRSSRGISQSPQDTEPRKAAERKGPEKPAQDLSGPFSASCDSDSSPSQNMEAGGIEPRTLDLQVLLQQALTCIGQEGLASCLVSLCGDQYLASLVEAWAGLPASRKRLIFDAVGDCDAK